MDLQTIFSGYKGWRYSIHRSITKSKFDCQGWWWWRIHENAWCSINSAGGSTVVLVQNGRGTVLQPSRKSRWKYRHLTTNGWGNNGGSNNTGQGGGAGGGGAYAVGGNATTNTGGPGGNGLSYSITYGPGTAYAGGGGGGGPNPGSAQSSGGAGGGGKGRGPTG